MSSEDCKIYNTRYTILTVKSLLSSTAVFFLLYTCLSSVQYYSRKLWWVTHLPFKGHSHRVVETNYEIRQWGRPLTKHRMFCLYTNSYSAPLTQYSLARGHYRESSSSTEQART